MARRRENPERRKPGKGPSADTSGVTSAQRNALTAAQADYEAASWAFRSKRNDRDDALLAVSALPDSEIAGLLPTVDADEVPALMDEARRSRGGDRRGRRR